MLNTAAAEMVQKSVLARCGAQAGVDEGLVTDPASCDWRPESIACPADKGGWLPNGPPGGSDQADHASGRQLEGRSGVRLWRHRGHRDGGGGWHYGRGNAPAAPGGYANYMLHDQFVKYMADPTVRKDVDPLKFDLDRGPACSRGRRRSTTRPLPTFAGSSRGGKLLMWHGLSDASILATSSIGYYEAVEKLMGSRAATQDFFRSFSFPAFITAAGVLVSRTSMPTLLENWVEKRLRRRDGMVSRKLHGVTERTRPIHPHPPRPLFGPG